MVRRTALASLAALTLAVALSGCAGASTSAASQTQSPSPTSTPVSEACAASDEFTAALGQARTDLGSLGSLSDVKTVATDITAAFDAYRDALSEASAEARSDFDSAWDSLTQSLSVTGSTGTLKERVDATKTALADVADATKDVATSLGCK